MNAGEKPLSAVPLTVTLALAATLAAHLCLRALMPGTQAAMHDLPGPPAPALVQVLALGEQAAASRLVMLWLLAFDYRGGNQLPYQRLDYARVEAWLSLAQALDPRSTLPAFAAARVYAEAGDPARVRRMLEFVHRRFLDDPDRHWPALAHAALLARHRLKDNALALRYAEDLASRVSTAGMPAWAPQMQAFILEDMNELEAARIVIGGLLASGRLTDPGERRLLEARLAGLEARLRVNRPPHQTDQKPTR